MAQNLTYQIVLLLATASGSALQEAGSAGSPDQTESRIELIDEQQFNWVPSWRISGSDCGQIAAYYIAKLHNKDLTLAEVKNDLPISNEKGVSCAEIASYLTKQGMPYETVWIPPDRFAELPLPAIIHIEKKIVETGHFLVLIGVDHEKDEFTLLDTSFEGISYVDGSFIRLPATGFAIVSKNMSRKFTTAFYLVGLCIAGIGAAFLIDRLGAIRLTKSMKSQIS